ncbi:hypothetical protein DFH08DRAFT_955700 [Mycena albidolilacea]|uniref:Uncharacterized protein n=1 Tax=Mycena albidolilacea TaxID=1033008 RepID=A0AAD7ABN2_9AGAR|nr:hypothetical protein DFH08DRAFT_955700 [Mycena albidolilacea]
MAIAAAGWGNTNGGGWGTGGGWGNNGGRWGNNGGGWGNNGGGKPPLPTLEADGQVYTSTAEVIRALIKDAPVKVKDGSAISETFHQDKYDPNFALILTPNPRSRS